MMELLTYLQNYEPDELVKVCNDTYTTRTHDSIIISNGYWNWFSKGIGGKNAISYLKAVNNYTSEQAIEIILDKMGSKPPITFKQDEKVKTKELILPQKESNCNRAKSYLMRRGIDENIIQECIENDLIYEEKNKHNIVFVGIDKSKKPQYAFFRGTNDTRFMGEAKGSNKKYAFSLEAKIPNKRVHLFESAIDLLSYATLLKMKNIDYHKENLISLAGVYQQGKEIKNSKIPVALQRFLNENPEVFEIYAHFDNDAVGRNASEILQKILPKKYKIYDRPAPVGKDCNDCLRYILERKRERKNTKEKVIAK